LALAIIISVERKNKKKVAVRPSYTLRRNDHRAQNPTLFHTHPKYKTVQPGRTELENAENTPSNHHHQALAHADRVRPPPTLSARASAQAVRDHHNGILARSHHFSPTLASARTLSADTFRPKTALVLNCLRTRRPRSPPTTRASEIIVPNSPQRVWRRPPPITSPNGARTTSPHARTRRQLRTHPKNLSTLTFRIKKQGQ